MMTHSTKKARRSAARSRVPLWRGTARRRATGVAALGAMLALLTGCAGTEDQAIEDDATDRPDGQAEVTQWLHDLSAQYEERDGVLSTFSAPAGGGGEAAFDGPVSVESLEVHCFGEEQLTVQVEFVSASGSDSIEVELDCAEGVREVAMADTDVDHSAVTTLDVRSSPPSEGRHYVVALGTSN